MAGNVWEWCLNKKGQHKKGQPETPESLRIDATDARRVIRGGAWYFTPGEMRSSNRSGGYAGSRNYAIGFRLAKDTL